MTFVEGRETWCRKRPFTSEIAHIRHRRTEAENSAASSANDVKRIVHSIKKLKNIPLHSTHPVCIAESSETTNFSSKADTTTRKPPKANRRRARARGKREAQSVRILADAAANNSAATRRHSRQTTTQPAMRRAVHA